MIPFNRNGAILGILRIAFKVGRSDDLGTKTARRGRVFLGVRLKNIEASCFFSFLGEGHVYYGHHFLKIVKREAREQCHLNLFSVSRKTWWIV